jgi:4-oxalocrotonate tautomerase
VANNFKEESMPVVRVSFYEGRSVEKKRKIAEAITDALVTIGGSTRTGVHVIFDNVKKEDWVIGGAPEHAKPEKPR